MSTTPNIDKIIARITKTGPVGDSGKSAYEYAVEGGYRGTKEEFMFALAHTTQFVRVSSMLELPNLGSSAVMYFVESDEGGNSGIYLWDEEKLKYIPYGISLYSIDYIYGGSSNEQ